MPRRSKTVISHAPDIFEDMTLEENAEALAQIMDSPMEPIMCACMMFLSSIAIQHAIVTSPTIPARIKLARSLPKLLRSGIKFLTKKRSREEFQALIHNLTQNCRCDQDPDVKSLEERLAQMRVKPKTSDPMNLRKAIHTVVDCIQLALHGQTKHKFRRTDKNSEAGPLDVLSSQPWPQDPEDLLPFGPVDSVDGLDLWAEGPGGYYMYRLATSLALYYHPFQEAMVRPPDFTFAIVRASKHLTGVMDVYEADAPSSLSSTSDALLFLGGPSLSSRSRSRDDPELFQWPISFIFDFFQILVNHDKFAAMMRTHGKTISPVLERLSGILSKLPAEEWITDTRVGIEVLRGFANNDLKGMSKRAKPLVDAIRDPIYDAFADMSMVRKGGCSNMTCPHAQDTVHARLCGQCNLMRFCGEKVRFSSFVTIIGTILTIELSSFLEIYSARKKPGRIPWSHTKFSARKSLPCANRLESVRGLSSGRPQRI